MTEDSVRIAAAWRAAAADLGIRVTAPATLRTAGGRALEVAAIVHDFGGPAGTVACPAPELDAVRAAARAGKHFLSGLNPELYRAYERQTFVEALEDWGWYGAGEPPAWYTGVSPWA